MNYNVDKFCSRRTIAYIRKVLSLAVLYGSSIQFLPREFELLPQLVKRFITPQKPTRDTSPVEF